MFLKTNRSNYTFWSPLRTLDKIIFHTYTRPLILCCYLPEKRLHNEMIHPSKRSKQIQKLTPSHGLLRHNTGSKVGMKNNMYRWLHRFIFCEAMCVVFHSHFEVYILCAMRQRNKPCAFPGFFWTGYGDVIVSPAKKWWRYILATAWFTLLLPCTCASLLSLCCDKLVLG